MKFLIVALVLASVAVAKPLPDCPQQFEALVDITDSMMPWPMEGSHLWFDYPRQMQRMDMTGFGETQSRIDNFNTNLSYIVNTPPWGSPTCRTCFLDDVVYPMLVMPFCTYVRDETLRGVECEVWHGFFGFQPAVIEMTFWVKKVAPQSILRTVFEDNLVMPHKLTMDFHPIRVGPINPAIWNPNCTCTEPTCKVPLELVLLVDGSGSISSSDFELMKQFAVKVTKQFTLSKDDVRVSVVQFSDRTITHVPLSASSQEVIKAIQGMSQIRSGTNMDAGLITTRNIITTQGRPGEKSAVIMFTDGEPDAGTDPVSVAQTLKDRGIEIYTVGVGSGVNPGLLKKIATQPPETHAFLADSFAKLQELLNTLLKSTCKGDKCATEQ